MTDSSILNLIPAAIRAADNAYIPYSGYRVGAALRAKDGTVFTGCNVENSAYPACICAERTALVKAVSEGVQSFDALVVATANGGSPCGHCRQMLFEFAPDMPVLLVDFSGTVRVETTLRDLLPYGFGPHGME